MRALLPVLVLASSLALTGTAQAAPGHAQITLSGSSSASDQVNSWISGVSRGGLQVVYTANGTSAGKQDFGQKTTDVGVLDVPFLGLDPVTGNSDTNNGRADADVPLIPNEVSFPYHLEVDGALVKNLRLSPLTLAKVFSGAITNWDDAEITSDNDGRTLPDLAITPLVHADGSAMSYAFSSYLAAEQPALWHDYSGLSTGTEFWPTTGVTAVNGSQSIINTITSAGGNGSIGMTEPSYAANAEYPVSEVENSSHAFVAPTSDAVAVALKSAVIHVDRSTDLTGVWTSTDDRAYPLSFWTEAVIPTSPTDSGMTTAKRQTIADFLSYGLCSGTLPLNLAQDGFSQIAQLHTADPGVDVSMDDASQCNGRYWSKGSPPVDTLDPAHPRSCDLEGQGPCTSSQGPTHATFQITSAALKYGTKTIVHGHLLYNSDDTAAPGDPAVVTFSPATGGTRTYAVKTDQNGAFGVPWTFTSITGISVEDAGTPPGGGAALKQVLAPISCAVSPSRVRHGSRSTLTCGITRLPKGTPVVLQVRKAGGAWQGHSRITSTSQRVAIPFSFAAAGSYDVRVLVYGSALYATTTGPASRVVLT